MLPTSERHGDANSDGVRIHYVELGPSDGPAVLMVHGFSEVSYSWRSQLPVLADAGYRAVVSMES
jgi:pimeloyl-ACP methyl ester carboxylesterase